MSLLNPSIVLRGDYAGHRDAFVTFRFRFCDDGTYYYAAQQGDQRFTLWSLAHRGRWDLDRERDPRTGRSGRLTIIRLEPQFIDVMPDDRTAKPMLEERGLPTDRIEKYVVDLSTSHNHWNRERDDVRVSFTIPDTHGLISTLSWSLEPVAND
jgi:hypothetical protein